jgi:F0F1-type ATP synthase assembly protein I
MSKQKFIDNPWSIVAMVGAIGGDLAITVTAGYYFGRLLVYWTGGGPIWLFAGILSGLGLGILSIIRLVRFYTGGNDE